MMFSLIHHQGIICGVAFDRSSPPLSTATGFRRLNLQANTLLVPRDRPKSFASTDVVEISMMSFGNIAYRSCPKALFLDSILSQVMHEETGCGDLIKTGKRRMA